MIFETPRQQRLTHLAVDGFLRGKQRVLHELLRDRGPTLAHGAGLHVGGKRAERAAQIHAVVLPETIVLDADNGVDHRFGDLPQVHRGAVFVRMQDRERAAVAALDNGPFA